MPINPGDIHVVTRNLARHASEAMTLQVEAVLEADRRRRAAQYAITDIAFGAFHSERYRNNYEGSLLAARREFDIPTPTETPVDRWFDRLRRH
jgi:hypothetical protein